MRGDPDACALGAYLDILAKEVLDHESRRTETE
jgi:hypothetical protein